MNPKAEEFLKGFNMVTSQDALDAIKTMDEEECIQFVRDFVTLMASWQPRQINVEGDSLKAAGVSLFLAKLSPLAFDKAYIHSDKLQTAKESITKVFK